ncbi:MAG TPA: ATP-binding protein, partial [Gammaproteobacteria bacterium]|nr:ATP-binding protein [Gammaproteobacteria bacterium]
AELIQDILIKFRPEADACGVALDMEDPPPLPPTVADIGLIERAVSNLIDNALHNPPSGGRVTLRVTRLPEHVRIEVSDTGYGIERDELTLVTQRFYRTRRARAHSREGSGLGLAITREIAALHGARLKLESEPGRGTSILFDLPTSAGAPLVTDS